MDEGWSLFCPWSEKSKSLLNADGLNEVNGVGCRTGGQTIGMMMIQIDILNPIEQTKVENTKFKSEPVLGRF